MKYKIIKFEIFSTIFSAILGAILHFTFNWSNGNTFIAAFSAVNESTWEHLKLIFFPMLITTIIGFFYLKESNYNFVCARAIGIISALAFIVTFFYTYSGIIGDNYAIVNILSFLFAIILGEYVSYRILISYIPCNKTFAIGSLLILLICFILFTYVTPQIGLFKDPIYNQYGIIRKNGIK